MTTTSTIEIIDEHKFAIACDLAIEYRRAEDIPDGQTYGGDRSLRFIDAHSWRCAIRSCATRMGVYDIFNDLVEEDIHHE